MGDTPFIDKVFELFGFLVFFVVGVGFTGVLIGALYAMRRNLPVVGGVFVALIAFGLFWEV
jgi:hypothetical protein